MAKSEKTPPTWFSLYGEPRGKHRDELLAADRWSSCLLRHDGGQDVVVLSLETGLAALDAAGVPIADGHAILADYLHRQLLAVVPSGWAHLWECVDDVRVVPYGSWIVVPSPGRAGSCAATWLSQPPPRLVSWEDQVEGEGEDETLLTGLRPDSLRAVVSAGALDPRRLYEALVGRPAACEAVTS